MDFAPQLFVFKNGSLGCSKACRGKNGCKRGPDIPTCMTVSNFGLTPANQGLASTASAETKVRKVPTWEFQLYNKSPGRVGGRAGGHILAQLRMLTMLQPARYSPRSSRHSASARADIVIGIGGVAHTPAPAPCTAICPISLMASTSAHHIGSPSPAPIGTASPPAFSALSSRLPTALIQTRQRSHEEKACN